MNPTRYHALNKKESTDGPILYWMDRDMRLHDNWALIRAQELAHEHNQPFGIVYNLVHDYLGGGARQYTFKLQGLKELEVSCKEKNIPFFVLLTEDSEKDILAFIKKQKVGYLVTDFNPLRLNQKWKKNVARSIDIPFEEVDAHNVVPVWVASEKQEFAVRTIRPKIHKNLREYLEEFPRIKKQKGAWKNFPKTDWSRIEKMEVDEDITPVTWAKGGEKAAKKMLRSFVSSRLKGYVEHRNDPTLDALSKLSPYFHYGMLSPARAVLSVKNADAPKQDREAFIEEAVVRRELSDNFCYYNKKYDSFDGFPEWAKKTLNRHREDKREYLYTKKQFELAKTHDPLWNAAQMEMVQTGKMHGYMRMYWAKKILEWTKTPEQALKIAIYLNDRYELDGRDPNGYVGCAWSIGGVHDRPWGERKIFGQVRYMNDKGCKRKFDTQKYIEIHSQETLL